MKSGEEPGAAKRSRLLPEGCTPASKSEQQQCQSQARASRQQKPSTSSSAAFSIQASWTLPALAFQSWYDESNCGTILCQDCGGSGDCLFLSIATALAYMQIEYFKDIDSECDDNILTPAGINAWSAELRTANLWQ